MSRVFIALAISCYGLFLRMKALNGRELWNAESYQFDCIKGHFKPFWLHQNYGDLTTFPGEYLLNYPVVHFFGRDKWALAFPHLLATILGFYLLFLLCRKYMRSWVGFAVAFLMFALNGELVSHALEFRPYAVLPVLALGSLYIAHWLTEDFQIMSLTAKWLTAISIFFMINYHAYGILIFTLPLMFVLVVKLIDLRGNGFSLPWRFLVLVLAVSLLVWLWYSSYNNYGFTKNSLPISPVNSYEFIASPLVHPVSFLKAVVGNLVGDRRLYVLLAGCFFIFVLPRLQQFKQLAFLLILVVLPILMILYFDIRSRYWFLQRQFIWVTPFFILWIAWFWDMGYVFLRRKRI